MTNYNPKDPINQSDFNKGVNHIKAHYEKGERALIEIAIEGGVTVPTLAAKLSQKLGIRLDHTYSRFKLTDVRKGVQDVK